MIRTITTGAVVFLVAAASTMILVNQARVVYVTSFPPLIVIRARATPETITYGEPLMVSVSMVRFRICDADLSTFVEKREPSDDYRVVLFRDRIPGGSGRIGPSETVSLFNLPKELKPGDYTFRIISHMRCEGAEDVHTILLPLVPFTVMQPPPTSEV